MTKATGPEVRLSTAERYLWALLETAQCWIHEQGLVLVEIECVLVQAGKLLYLYRGRLSADKLPAPLRTRCELIVWARPERAEDDASGLDQYAHWFARWLVLCLPGEEDLQNEVCCQILIRAQSRAQRFVY
jgi:hypothetical protein